MKDFFEYPVSRPYPWRFTTISIVLASSAVLAALIYVNLTIVGVTTYTKYSSTFQPWKTPSWAERLSINTI
ncbi:hypothetical protein FRC07_005798, partial [Ceratobasidium sp. 392]